VNLKPVLGQIETDCDNLHGGRLLSVVAFTDDHVVAHRCRGAGAVHPIKIFAPLAALGFAWFGAVPALSNVAEKACSTPLRGDVIH
jgi:hypothetical protein